MNEKEIPISISNVLRSFDHILPEHIKTFLESSDENLKFSESSTFEKARQWKLELHYQKCVSHKTDEKLRIKKYDWNISNLKQKL